MNILEAFLSNYGMEWRPVASNKDTLEDLVKKFVEANKNRTFDAHGFNQRDVLYANLFGTQGRIFVSNWEKYVKAFEFEDDYSLMPTWLGEKVYFYGNVVSGAIEVSIIERNVIHRSIEKNGEQIPEKLWERFPEYQLQKAFNPKQAMDYLKEKQRNYLESYYAELVISKRLRKFNEVFSNALNQLLNQMESPEHLIQNGN